MRRLITRWNRLPKFVEREFREFLTCGVLAHGFARLRCGVCAVERLVPFSCKGRGFCPSCGGRRMTEAAARLVEDVLPRVPARQWVLSLPHRLRYHLAWDHNLARAVLGVFVRVLLAFQRRRTRQRGIRGGHSGSVTIILRSENGAHGARGLDRARQPQAPATPGTGQHVDVLTRPVRRGTRDPGSSRGSPYVVAFRLSRPLFRGTAKTPSTTPARINLTNGHNGA